MKTADRIIEQAKSWIGKKESDGSHQEIIDVYNSYRPLPRGYALSYNDAWCAAFVSALAIKCGYTDIIPLECSCGKMIEKFKQMGCWIEDENRIPNIGDIVFYDWEDNGSGDNKDAPNHVGVVSAVDVSRQAFDVIEGNKTDAVAVRTVSINGKYLRGFGVPKYESEGVSSIIYIVQKGDTLRKIASFYGVTVDDILACNAAKIKNPDSIKAGWEINIPVPYVSEGSEGASVSKPSEIDWPSLIQTVLRDIKQLDSYNTLLAALKESGD